MILLDSMVIVFLHSIQSDAQNPTLQLSFNLMLWYTRMYYTFMLLYLFCSKFFFCPWEIFYFLMNLFFQANLGALDNFSSTVFILRVLVDQKIILFLLYCSLQCCITFYTQKFIYILEVQRCLTFSQYLHISQLLKLLRDPLNLLRL